MSEMFTKCNGFIVSGDPLVYADSATMTGQGTVSDPFGVKSTDLFVQEPLYTGTSGSSAYIGWNNETVLWSSNTVQSAANLSEPMTAFDYVKVYYADDFTDTGRYHTVAQLDPNFGAYMWQPVGGLGEANAWIGITYFSADNSYTTLCVPKVKLMNFGAWSSTTTGITKVTTGANVSVIYKVIGVNRKA